MPAEPTTTVHVDCRLCRQTTRLIVPVNGISRWQGGELIQSALPGLTVDERELLISGTCGSCFDDIFGTDD